MRLVRLIDDTGDVARENHTSQMIRGVREIIASLSRHMTLRQRAMILTGVPPVAATSTVTDGAKVEAEIDGIGRLTNVCHCEQQQCKANHHDGRFKIRPTN